MEAFQFWDLLAHLLETSWTKPLYRGHRASPAGDHGGTYLPSQGTEVGELWVWPAGHTLRHLVIKMNPRNKNKESLEDTGKRTKGTPRSSSWERMWSHPCHQSDRTGNSYCWMSFINCWQNGNYSVVPPPLEISNLNLNLQKSSKVIQKFLGLSFAYFFFQFGLLFSLFLSLYIYLSIHLLKESIYVI